MRAILFRSQCVNIESISGLSHKELKVPCVWYLADIELILFLFFLDINESPWMAKKRREDDPHLETPNPSAPFQRIQQALATMNSTAQVSLHSIWISLGPISI